MKKRLLVTMLALAMVATLFAGCGKKSKKDGDSAKGTEAGTEVSTEEGTEGSQDEPPVNVPEITSNDEVKQFDSCLMVGDTCYELFNYNDDRASDYAKVVNYLAAQLDGKARVIDVIVPISTQVTFPDNLEAKTCTGLDTVKDIAAKFEDNVIAVNPMNVLLEHRTEYIYYRTDHHWTGLGAYYTYSEFCKQAGFECPDLSQYTERSYEGFLGSFYNDNGKPENLKNNPDTVYAYVPLKYSTATMTVTDKKGQTFNWPVLCDVSNVAAGNKYGTFICGDNPYTVIENESITDGSSCVVIKESFGNAFVPYLLDNYQTVHVIDYRYWDGKLIDFVNENGINDVILCNNTSMIRSKKVATLANLVF